ncbi:uncharacterized protein LOC122019170 [Zingiber officinale]|uniref:uncharacterized protein LOC122019170 n=1 Tax=Zingiber officinale TaxID=94328 RepID=UPI001C4C75ED|nr:uncharacterized protein LOC122019170 [Zingiber officinale]
MTVEVSARLLTRRREAIAVDHLRPIDAIDTRVPGERWLGNPPNDIEETFHTLRMYGVKLNPQKCLFGAKSGRFLGYIITERGIEANPSKVKALQDMPPPRNLKEVQHLTGRITDLSRFISKTADRSMPFFKILRRTTKFQWDKECDRAFESLKVYINSLPVLAKPTIGEPLRIYLSSTEHAVGSALTHSWPLSSSWEPSRLKLYVEAFDKLKTNFGEVVIQKIPRAENRVADELVKLASSITPIVTQQSIEQVSLVAHIDRMEDLAFPSNWRMTIVEFLQSGAAPSDRVEAQLLRRRAGRFTLIGDQLYKKVFSRPLLKCVSLEDAKYILKEVHQGSCGRHPGGQSLAKKILLAGYFWPTLQEDAARTVATCLSCQRYHNFSHRPTEEMKASTWVEAELLAKITEQMVNKFIWKHIICRFGIPRWLVSDNGWQFVGQQLREWCEGYGIQQHFTSVAYLQSNGHAEVANREILLILRVQLNHIGGS